MTEIADFLLARISEDEDLAKDASWREWSAEGIWIDGEQYWSIGLPDHDDGVGRRIILESLGPNGRADVFHVRRWDPARVLAECEAKRRIIAGWGNYETYNGEELLKVLALPYVDHEDFQDKWRAS